MSASLVGSEMCIRDSHWALSSWLSPEKECPPCRRSGVSGLGARWEGEAVPIDSRQGLSCRGTWGGT
eukprot:4297086-Alexandrium_andersonii.AAC.1